MLAYLHDDVEGVVHQEVDDEDGQEVGRKVTRLHHQPVQRSATLSVN